jgi:hypothetical protein
MRVKHLAEKNKMVKGKAMNAATNWVPSAFMQKNLDKAKVDGLISDNDSVIFPSTERIPKPKSGFRVMFLAFLLRSLSLPAHEFLRGLLYVYGVQLHQLTPNSLLHIACFITLCESFFWGPNPILFSGGPSFGSAPASPYRKNLSWAELSFLCVLNLNT